MWKNIDQSRQGSVHYSVLSLANRAKANGMAALREMFPTGEADDLNVVLFSTSGIHGTYVTIEEVEATIQGRAPEDEACRDVTFLVIHPRLVCLRYGICEPTTQDDIDFLKKLRASSHRFLSMIGEAS